MSKRNSRTDDASTPRSSEAGWRWRTFPVFAAFMLGLLVAVVINGEPNNAAAAVLVWVAVFGCSYALAHFLVVRLLLPRRARRAREDDGYEEVAVYPDE